MNIKNYFLILLAIFFCAEGHAKFTDLIENSPFIPEGQQSATPSSPKAVKPKVQVSNNKFTLKGIVIIGNDYVFSVYDETTQKTEWLSPNETTNGFTIRSYDPQELTVYYEWNGIRGTAQLKNPDDSWVKLTFLNEKEVAVASRVTSDANNNGNPSRLSRNNSLERSKVYKQLRNAERINFSSYGSSVGFTGSGSSVGFAGVSSTGGNNQFASTDAIGPNQASESPRPDPTLFGIRRNKINNPSGTPPKFY